MKVRLFAFLAAALVLVSAAVMLAGTASADAGPHSKRSSVVAGCQGCHRAHTAADPSLLFADQFTLCTSCHGVGSVDGDVINGFMVAEGPLRGGGFVNAWLNTTHSGTQPAAAAPTTSQHDVVGLGSYTSDTVWGLGAVNSGAGPTFALQCATCHDPHGGSGNPATNIPVNTVKTYRILRGDLGAKVTGAGAVTVPDSVGGRVYTINDTTTYHYYGQLYPLNADSDTTGTTTKIDTISNWCGACHQRIHATGAGTGSTSSGDNIYTYRHRTDGTSVAFNFNATGAPVPVANLSAPACLTCHVAHGSNAANTYRGNPITVPVPGGDPVTGPFQDSALLRLDARGVCEACHNK